jgi:hypothetical protein
MVGAGARFQWMSLKRRRLSETEENLEEIIRKDDDHCIQRAPARLPSASSAAQRLLLLPAIGSWSRAGDGKSNLSWQRFEGWRLGERLGAPTVLFIGLVKRSWPWIVAHIPRNLESGEVFLTDSPSGRLEFKLSHIRLTGSAELRSECCSGIALFGHSY